jgi:hypothetical protein
MSERDRIHQSSIRRPLHGSGAGRDHPVQGRGKTRGRRKTGTVEPKYGTGRSLDWTEERRALDTDRDYGAGNSLDRDGNRRRRIRRGKNAVDVGTAGRSKYRGENRPEGR